MINKILLYIFNPLRAFANKSVAEKMYVFCNKNKWVVYVTSFVVTGLIIFLAYILPNL